MSYPIGTAKYFLPIQISGQYTATVAEIALFKVPVAGKVVGITATARASGGTTPTLTVDVQQGTTSLLSTPVAVTAGTVATATLATTPTWAADTEISIDFAIGGTNPTWDDVSVMIEFQEIVT